MFLSLLPTRLLSRHVAAASSFSAQRVLAPAAARSFSMSRIALAASATDTPVKKTSSSKGTKKTEKSTKKSSKENATKLKKPTKKKETVKPAKVKVTSQDMPPPKPGGPYFVFFRKYFADVDLSNASDKRTAIVQASKDAAAVWQGLSESEKQVYRDEYVAARAVYEKKREEYFKTVDPAVLKEINRRRAARGKPKIKTPTTNRKPLTSFFLYLADERKALSPVEGPDGPEQMIAFAKARGEKWRTMSDADKQTYVDRYNEAKKEFDASL
ncbi:hypothetical protein M0805_006719 [Coniferiporia weirii]|nr:hypothetical protein M0805_006719 [Coniferiporia weirii]